jgi:hypothetical protein
MLSALFVSFLVSSSASRSAFSDSTYNLALQAKATASEQQGNLAPELAIDGRKDTRWSGIPGHNEGVWFQLTWPKPVTISQVLLHQYDRYVTQLDVQTWDESTSSWKTQTHLGDAASRLPKVAAASFDAVKTTKLRIGNIANGPSFTEVEVYEKPLPPKVVLGSDVNGNFLGIACDFSGNAPVQMAKVELSGESVTGKWKTTATTDQHGLFIAKMPLGLKGEVKAKCADGEFITPAANFQYGLTPLSHRANVSSLNGTWRFQLDPADSFWKPESTDADWHDIKVPRSWSMEGYRSITGIAGYRKVFECPKGTGRIKLRFDGVYSGAEVWVNGQRVAYHEGGALPFEVDITDVAREGSNLLALKVTEHTATSDLLDAMSSYADISLGGIMRKVTLFRVPEVHVGAYALATRWDKAYKDASVQGSISVVNESNRDNSGLTVDLHLVDSNGKVVSGQKLEKPLDLKAWQRAEIPVDFTTLAPKPWNAEQPNLYTLVIEVKSGGKTVQELKTRWGFRQSEVKGSELFINGKPVKVRGTCHHDSDPLLGRAVTPEQELLDVRLMKEANLNGIRTSHYASLPELMDYADELGMYVEDEGSFCWTGATDDLTLTPRVMQLNCELVARDRNRPSVYTWSICNESTVGYGLWRSFDWVKKSDPSRPLTASYQADGSMDFAVRHNPMTLKEMTEIEDQLKGKTPVLWDECWCIWQDIWGDAEELWIDPGIRDYYIEPLPELWKRFMASPVVQGTKIWAWSDDIFLIPGGGLEYGRADTPLTYATEAYNLQGRGIAGDAQWGVVDGWRRKKPEFYHIKKLHSPVKVSEAPLQSETTLRIPVTNEYDFLNLSDLNIAWSVGAEKGIAHANVAPHSDGVIEVNLPRTPQVGEGLGLAIADKKGNVIDSYRLTFGKRSVSPMPAKAKPRPLKIATQSSLSGETRFILNDNFEIGVNTYTNGLRRGLGFGRALLRSLPVLHLSPTGSPNAPLPDLRKWQLTDLQITPEGDNVRVVASGEYPAFKGSYHYLIHPDGTIDAQVSFVYSGEEVRIREQGMVFSVPREADLLVWDRNGEYSVYPEDHIGRSRGQTRSVANHKATVPPTWSWSEDNSPLGTNDFRSIKRNLNWGWIGYPDGPGVVIESNGKQAFRATVAGERIEVCVNDFYGGTASRWEWEANYGKGKLIKKGDKIEASVQIRLAPSR